MNASVALPAVNFFMADVGGGLGPFLSTWLAESAHWGPGKIGWVVAGGSIAGALAAAPAGSLIDRFGKPRLMLAIATGGILLGTLLLLPFRAFAIVLAAQIVVAAGGALGGPSISALTLAVVGKRGYPRQQGRNEAANHAGNVTAAGLIALLSWWIGAVAAVAVLAAMAAATLATLWSMNRDDVDGDRMRGREKRQRGAKRGLTRALYKDKRLWTLLAVVLMFQMGNSAMLPLLGQRIVEQGSRDATAWMSGAVITASLTMIPVALLIGHLADRKGRRWPLILACSVVILRCAVAMFAHARLWLVPIEILDGICAATFSVSIPLAIADLTYGGGRTQTAMGTMAMFQAGGGALASVVWGNAAVHFGYAATFGAMAVFPAIAVGLLFTLELADDPAQPDAPAASGKAASGKAAAMSAAA